MTHTNFRIFKQVPRLIYGDDSLNRLNELLPGKSRKSDFYIFIIDSFHENSPIFEPIISKNTDLIFYFSATSAEPKTSDIDALCNQVKRMRPNSFPLAIIGIGGGSTMDVAKGLSVMLCNDGVTSDYQGWDLVKNRGIYKVGIPTIFGSGAEASRTAVFMGKEKKFGINSDFSMFDAILIDPTFECTVPKEIGFYSGMDCFIHCVESAQGTMINEIAKAYATKALELCSAYYLEKNSEQNHNKIATASYLGGVSIVNSEVGVCHALSYGLSMELGLRHGYANCLVFNALDKYYGKHVDQFREMLNKHNISLAPNQCKNLTELSIQRMINMTMLMERPLINALGTDWQKIFTADKIAEIYSRI